MNKVELIPPDGLSESPCFAADNTYHNFLNRFCSYDSRELIANVQTTWQIVNLDHILLPMTINDCDYDNSYVCSPYNGAITYPLEELRLIPNAFLKLAMRGVINTLSPLLRAGKINQLVAVNNYLISTNLYPDFNHSLVPELTRLLVEQYPAHAIMLRSLNTATNAKLLDTLKHERYLLIPSRQLYILDTKNPAFLKKRDIKYDQKLLAQTDYSLVRHDDFTDSDDKRIIDLYNQLYLEKYSTHNPHFSEQLIRLWRKTGQLKFIGLRSPQGRLDGIVGLLQVGKVISSPVIGYEMSAPQSAGLYRLLTILGINQAHERKLMFNLSSGVGEFKRLRGAKAYIEYSAVYCKHLPKYRQRVWQMLHFILHHIGVPALKKYEL